MILGCNLNKTIIQADENPATWKPNISAPPQFSDRLLALNPILNVIPTFLSMHEVCFKQQLIS